MKFVKTFRIVLQRQIISYTKNSLKKIIFTEYLLVVFGRGKMTKPQQAICEVGWSIQEVNKGFTIE